MPAAPWRGASLWHWRSRQAEIDEEQLRRLFEELELASTTRLGASYLEIYPEEADAGKLYRLLFPGGGAGAADDSRTRLVRDIGRDWAEIETVRLEGWIVSRTEGRLLALASLPAAAR